MSKSGSNVKQFPSLSEAVAFIVACLESDAQARLLSECERGSAHLVRNPDYLDHFSRFVFSQLRDKHQETDLRTRYSDRVFPEDGTKFKLGGHMQELGCIHIDFVKRESGWALRDIWLCR